MNKELIERLANRAGMLRDSHGIYHDAIGNNDDGIDLTNFVELIVKQCSGICYSVAEQAELVNNGEMARKTKATAVNCATLINKIFGVDK